MFLVLANDPQIARQWAESRGVSADAWCSATTEKLRAIPTDQRGDYKLVILDGAEMSPQYSLILDIAKDREIEIASGGGSAMTGSA